MNSKFKYKILPEYGLIIEKWIGDFDISKIIYFKSFEISDPDWRNYYNVLADDTASNKNMQIAVESDKDEYFKLSKKFLKKHKVAVLTKLPNQVVGSTFMKSNLQSHALIQIETFSTIERSLSWLGIDLKEIDKIESILEQLSND